MRAPGSDPNHIAYRSVYPDASIAETFDRMSSTKYTLHGTVRSGGKTTTSVDTCLRGATLDVVLRPQRFAPPLRMTLGLYCWGAHSGSQDDSLGGLPTLC